MAAHTRDQMSPAETQSTPIQLTFRHRVGFLWTCVAPAFLLSEESGDGEESLQAVASLLGLCYLQVLRSLENGTYLARVARSPDAFGACTYTVLFSEDQLRFVLPWDCRLQSLSPEHVLRMLAAHAAAIAPLTRLEQPAHDQVTEPSAEAAPTPPASVEPEHEDVALSPLPPVFVPQTTMLDAFRHLEITCKQERRVHTAILHAVLETLQWKVEQTYGRQERHALEQQYEQVQQVRRWRRKRYGRGHGWQRVVALESVSEYGTQGWKVVVGVPLAA